MSPIKPQATWRENIHNTLKLADKRWALFLPQIVINAVDSAYVAGLDDREKLIQEIDKILEQGHGGGNWRRLIMQLKDTYDK